MHYIIYDGSFEGLLSAVGERYVRKLADCEFVSAPPADLFANAIEADPLCRYADRISEAVMRNASKQSLRNIYMVFLSERPDREKLISYFIHRVLFCSPNSEEDYSDNNILEFRKICKMMRREIHRMHAFVRFSKDENDVFTAAIEPDFDVLPLIGEHFRERYADQRWLILDRKRRYGIFYDLASVSPVFPGAPQATVAEHADEAEFSTLWKRYFVAVNIPERRNLKLHQQHVPKRYWKLLTEKN